MRHCAVQIAATLLISSSAFAQARVVITEVMYNPASNEKKNEAEWVEIANVGTETIELTDWSLKVHEKKTKWGKITCTLAPGGVAVLINADACTEEQFRAAWDEVTSEGSAEAKASYQVLAIKWGGLSNEASGEHPLQLLNAEGEVKCEVKSGPNFPKVTGAGGPSVFLADANATELSDGANWRIATLAMDGARHNKITEVFDKEDIGSPGYVPGLNGNPVATTPAVTKRERKLKDAADTLIKETEKAADKAKETLPGKIDY